MEIERKFLISKENLPADLDAYPHHKLEQGYLSTAPVVRIRKEDDNYYLTYKSKGLMTREEYNLPLTKESYEHMRPKADGILISKTRYLIPEKDRLTIELDVFDAPYEGLYLAEVEFSSEEQAQKMNRLMTGGKSHVTFIIGGSLGLSGRVSGRADMKLSFSKMTFPHQMMRIILLEQIYRSFKIISNETYHK